MAIRVLIVDDEKWMRDVIASSIEWETEGFTVIGEACDGIEALNMIRLLEPEIVLTDIQIPGIDGITLLERVKEMGLNSIFIYFSGYDRFEYVQRAINLGAMGFVLKPVEEEELLKMLIKAKDYINSEKLKMESREKLNDLSEREQERAKGSLLFNILNGMAGCKSEIESDMDKYGIRFSEDNFLVETVNLDDYSCLMKKNSVEWMSAIIQKLNQAFKIEIDKLGYKNCEMEVQRGISFIIGLHDADLEIGVDEVRRASNEALYNFSTKHCLTATVGLGSIYSGIENASKSYSETLKAIEYRMILGKNRIIDVSEVKTGIIRNTILDSKLERLVTDCIEKADYPLMDKDIIDLLKNALLNSNINVESIKVFNYHFVELVFRVLERNGVLPQNVLGNPHLVCDKLDMSEDFGGLLDQIRNILHLSLDAVSNSETGYYNKLISKIKKYLQENYMYEISLETVAYEFSFHPNYFSKLFKEGTGENFIDYLTNLRIKESRDLLKDIRNNVFEVSRRVGYKDAKYFTKVFKKVVGITPKDYIGKYR